MPTRAAVAASSGKLVVTWQPPDPDTGSLVHGYTVRHKLSGAADSTYAETTVHPRRVEEDCEVSCKNPRTLEITGLAAGTYVVGIQSLNANGASPWHTIGSDPQNLRAQADNDHGIIVSWDAPSDLGGSTLDGYRVQWVRTADGTTAQSDLLETRDLHHRIEDLVEGSPYSVRVAAVATDSGNVQSSTWTAPIVVAEVWQEPMQVWFSGDTPFYNNRLFLFSETNKIGASTQCGINGGNVSCTPGRYTSTTVVAPNAAFTVSVTATLGTESVTSLLQEGRAAGPAPPQAVRASGGKRQSGGGLDRHPGRRDRQRRHQRLHRGGPPAEG